MTQTKPYRPVVILGAGRSGTNILRDCLTRLPDFATWPCDEIQPIWRYRNRPHPTDCLPAAFATDKVKTYINGAFDAIWKATGKPAFVVEKTCANTLRVPFVDAVLDDAFYINLVRHGSNVVPSAVKRWRGELEVPSFSYFAAKARYIPLADVPSFLFGFVNKRIGKLLGRQAHLSSWGPRFDGIDDYAKGDLDIVCAHQWAACVTQTQDALRAIDPDRVITIYYEDFLSDPASELARILDRLQVDAPADQIKQAVQSVRTKDTDKLGSAIANPDVRKILSPVLNDLGYGEKT